MSEFLTQQTEQLRVMQEKLDKAIELVDEINGFFQPQPAKKEWVGLTDEEIDQAVLSCQTTNTYNYFRAIEAALKEKNS